MKTNFFNKTGHKISLCILLSAFGMGMTQDSFADTLSPRQLYQYNINGSRTLLYHVPSKEIWKARKLGHLANQSLQLQFILSSKDQAGLDKFVVGLYDPNSPNFGKFLTPDQFDALYGASSIDSSVVTGYLKLHGFTVTHQSKNGFLITATAQVSDIESAFKVKLNQYMRPDGTSFFATEDNPTISAEAGNISAIAGLDNVKRFKANNHLGNQLNGMNAKSLQTGDSSAATPGASSFSGYGGNVGPADITAAYNLNALGSKGINGSGQTLALFELDAYTPGDIQTFETYYKLPSVLLVNINSADWTGPTQTDPYEPPLDIELAIAVAPGLKTIYIYQAQPTSSDWAAQWNQIAEDDKANVISSSWGAGTEEDPYFIYNHVIFEQLAAQGQTVINAAGDSGAYSNCDNGTLPPNCLVDGAPATGVLSVQDPASDPYVTGVGISVLTANNAGTSNESYGSETASIDGGGGISSEWPTPPYQMTAASHAPASSMVSTTWRNVPDVVLNGDQTTCYGIVVSGNWKQIWGSSAAAPVWAAFISRVNQGRASAGQLPIGFLNPALYQIAQSGTSYAADFHDIISGTNSYYPAGPGFDDATGLGSFNGLNLYNDLVNYTPANTVPPAPTGLTASGSYTDVALSWKPVQGAVAYAVCRSTAPGVSCNSNTQIAPFDLYTTYIDNDPTLKTGTTYYYVVSAVNAVGKTSTNSNPASASLLMVPPMAPTGLTATGGGLSVALSWNASPGALSYTVCRSASPGVSCNNKTQQIQANVSNTSYTDMDPNLKIGTTYYYVVIAVNSYGPSGSSNQVSAIPVTFPAPTGLTASEGGSDVILSWNAVTGAVSYNVWRTTNPNGQNYAQVNCQPGGPTFAVEQTSCTDHVTLGMTYYYVVQAVNAAHITSAYSKQVIVIVGTLPPTPTGFSATPGNAQVTLSWNASPGATYYILARTGGAVPWVSNQILSTKYPDTGLQNGQTYDYVIWAYNTTGNSAASAPVPATPTPIVMDATATPNSGTAPLTVNFKVSSLTDPSGAILFYIWDFGDGSKGGGITTSHIYTNPGTYKAQLSVIDNKGNAAFYNFSAITVTPAAPPQPPVNLQVIPGDGHVMSMWLPSLNATSYNVKRSTTSGKEVTIYSTSNTAYNDNNNGSMLQNGTTYYYVVSALNAAGVESANSAEISATPEHSSTITATAGSGGSITPSGTTTVRYNASPNYMITPNTGYEIASVIVDGKSLIGTPTSTPITYPFTNVTANHTITATFVRAYILLGIANGNGSISPTNALVISGNTQKFTILPKAGNSAYVSIDGSMAMPVDSSNTVSIEDVTAPHIITATFKPITYSLAVIAPNGKVVQTVNGVISQGPYNAGTPVTLTATPDSGYQFTLWNSQSGDVTGTSNTVTFTINTNEAVIANFTAIPQTFTLSVNAVNGAVIQSSVYGTIRSSSYAYPVGTVVTLTALPNTEYRLGNWSGAVTGENTTTSVTMNGNESVTATFVKNWSD